MFKFFFHMVLITCVQGQESDSSETSVRGPRIKHVCRRAAVALGRNRAVFPDDMPTLSALPWEEREKILSSMGNDGSGHLCIFNWILLLAVLSYLFLKFLTISAAPMCYRSATYCSWWFGQYIYALC